MRTDQSNLSITVPIHSEESIILLQARRAGLRIVEIPIHVREQRLARDRMLMIVPRTLTDIITSAKVFGF